MSGPLAYYNEIDPDAALILRALIADGVIARGEVDTRSIIEVQPDDLTGFTQCHFFAGGGLWSVAARMAGWPDDGPLWTASCPCQPFSVAGKGGGTDDARHLWPDLLRLASARRPARIVGEQVAGKAGYGWFDGVRADLEREGYASRYVDIPACAVDAPHIRQRGYWIALADAEGLECGSGLREGGALGDGAFAADRDGGAVLLADSQGVHGRRDLAVGEEERRTADRRVDAGRASGVTLGDAFGSRLEGFGGYGDGAAGRALADRPIAAADGGDMEHTNFALGRLGHQQPAGQQPEHEQEPRAHVRTRSRNGSFWSDHEWIACHDGKARRTQPGVPLLVDGLPGRVGLWRVAGNAISPVLAAEVIGALMDTHPDILAEIARLNQQTSLARVGEEG